MDTPGTPLQSGPGWANGAEWIHAPASGPAQRIQFRDGQFVRVEDDEAVEPTGTAYTDADVQAALNAHYGLPADYRWPDETPSHAAMRAALDAVAPAIAARALRQAVGLMRSGDLGHVNEFGHQVTSEGPLLDYAAEIEAEQ